MSTSPNDLILDFFAGSGTTAQAVLEMNATDNGNRKFILVQLPEKTDNPQYPTIAEITKERVRRVCQRLREKRNGTLSLEDNPPDLGFKVLKLAPSVFKTWNSEFTDDPTEIEARLFDVVENLQPESQPLDILFEILLRGGYDLNAPCDTLAVQGVPLHRVQDPLLGTLLVCMDDGLTLESLREIAALKPNAFVALDGLFTNNDALLTNAALEMEQHGIHFRTY
jgi:adenine-specific DNA-methyltransferase